MIIKRFLLLGSYNGDNGQATAAAIYSPYGVSLDSSGTIAYHAFKIYWFMPEYL